MESAADDYFHWSEGEKFIRDHLEEVVCFLFTRGWVRTFFRILDEVVTMILFTLKICLLIDITVV